mmetsp:Transcript_31539/g.102764  ORF Transcript_31539/g.102764 Transcript_31539/m.102764 type:complete len:230 (+) Transcript_31539:900-1589(+)
MLRGAAGCCSAARALGSRHGWRAELHFLHLELERVAKSADRLSSDASHEQEFPLSKRVAEGCEPRICAAANHAGAHRGGSRDARCPAQLLIVHLQRVPIIEEAIFRGGASKEDDGAVRERRRSWSADRGGYIRALQRHRCEALARRGCVGHPSTRRRPLPPLPLAKVEDFDEAVGGDGALRRAREAAPERERERPERHESAPKPRRRLVGRLQRHHLEPLHAQERPRRR